MRPQRVDQPVRLAGGRRIADQPHPVQLRVHLRGGQPLAGDREHPVPPAGGQYRGELISPAGAQRGPAGERERHIAAQVRGELQQVRAVQAGAPQRVAGHQRGRRVRAAAGQPARDRDPLDQVEPHRRGHSGPVGQQRRGLPGQVGIPGRQILGALALHPHAQVPGRRRGDLVVQRHGMEDGDQIVEPVRARRPDRQVQVHLRGHPDAHGLGYTKQAGRRHRPSLSPGRVCLHFPAITARSVAGACPVDIGGCGRPNPEGAARRRLARRSPKPLPGL